MKLMEPLDLREKGGVRGGVQQTSEHRLFMQLLAFGGMGSAQDLVDQLAAENLPSTLYADVNDPRGVALLTWSDDPTHFACRVRTLLNTGAFGELELKPEYSMLGRSYSLGHEPQLEDWLLDAPRRRVTDPEWPWAVWYPLRRKGEFASLSPEEQSSILREHGRIGHSFGEAGAALDVRLACFGLDKNDSDFIIGLIGKELFPLSACVQAMRRTKQTSTYIETMGPFFVGRAIYQRI
jgi:chlorite dismutase